jgi:UDP-N-acetylglucosamine 2-epimerase (non-hydrolysing)
LIDILLVVGARPNFVKAASLRPALEQAGFSVRVVHTGQHFDRNMSQVFFDELDLHPDILLNVGSSRIPHIYKAFKEWCVSMKPLMVMVVGDVNSTLACAFAAYNADIPVVHVEAGLRSFDMSMPEEVNRTIVDRLSSYLFVSEPSGMTNLANEGLADKAHFVGNVMADTLLSHLKETRELRWWKNFSTKKYGFGLVTLHRKGIESRSAEIWRTLYDVSQKIPLVFPYRKGSLGQGRPGWKGCFFADPMSYLEFISTMRGAKFVLTDSGGVQEEATIMDVPCLTMRENTERPITTQVGSNRLVGFDRQLTLDSVDEIIRGSWPHANRPILWDGNASKRIAEVLRQGV